MRRFRKKPQLSLLFLPGMGRVKDDQILVGDHFAKFVPNLLEELVVETVSVEEIKKQLMSELVVVAPAEPVVPEATSAPKELEPLNPYADVEVVELEHGTVEIPIPRFGLEDRKPRRVLNAAKKAVEKSKKNEA